VFTGKLTAIQRELIAIGGKTLGLEKCLQTVA